MKTNQHIRNWIFLTLRESAWAPLCIVGFYIFGLAFDLYDRYPPLDIPTHFMGGVAITYFYSSAIRNAQNIVGEIPFPVQSLLAFTSTGTTIIFWEFYENTIDYLFGFNTVRGLEETIVDMAMGLLGALVLSWWYRKR